jgi:hypothetical protein
MKSYHVSADRHYRRDAAATGKREFVYEIACAQLAASATTACAAS